MNKQIRFLNKLELVGAFLFLGYWFLEQEPLKTIFLILSAILIIPIVIYTLIASIRDKEYFLQFGGNTEDVIGNIGFEILLAVYLFNTNSYAWAGILLLCVAAFRIGLICYNYFKNKA